MTEATLLSRTTSDKPSVAGDGVTLSLAGGETRELRFSARNIIKVENLFDSHDVFLDELNRMPLNTLACVLIQCCGVENEDKAIGLLDGVNWRELVALVDVAWRRANWMPDQAPPATPDPTSGS